MGHGGIANPIWELTSGATTLVKGGACKPILPTVQAHPRAGRVPPHAWSEGTVAKLLAPYCWIEEVEAVTTAGNDLSTFRLAAWAKHPCKLPKILWLNVTEPT